MSEEDPLARASANQLLAALDDTDYGTRVRAACAVGDQLRFGKVELNTALRQALIALVRAGDLRGEWDDLRFEAAIALCEANDPSAAILSEALGDAKRRFDALKALSHLSPTPPLITKVKAVFEKWFLYWPDRLAAAAALAKWGEAQGETFFEKTLAFAATPFHRRALAVYLLGDLRMTNAFLRLTKIAEDESDTARGAAIRAIGHLQDPRAIEWLKRDWPEPFADDIRYATELFQ